MAILIPVSIIPCPPVLLAASLGLLIIILQRRASSSAVGAIPGPWLAKWTDLPLQFHWLAGRRAKYVHSLHQQYVDTTFLTICPIVRLSPGEVSVSDISASREIHRVGGQFLKSPWYLTLNAKGVQNLFNTIDPQFHGRHRRLLSMPMSDTSLRGVEPLVNSKIQFTIQRMKGDIERTGVVDVYKWWILMASDIISELSFGESLGLLETGMESPFITDLKAVGTMEGLNTTFPCLVNLASIFPLPFIPDVVSGGHRMVQYADEAIARYKKHLVTNAENPKVSLFTRIYEATEDGLTDAEVRDDALSYIIAGSDTTATSLTYLVWAVCRSPRIKQALLEEVNSLPDGFNDQDTRRLSFLGQVINETLRLYAAAPSGLLRVVPSGGRVLAGHFVPAGVTVSTQAYSLHRDPTIFPDPDSFNPSRWENATKLMKDAFMPFGGGSRICIGLHLALREIRLATCYFFRTFPHAEVFDEKTTDADMEQVIYFLMAPKGKRCFIKSPGSV